jgi:hypothetical protein
MSNEKQDEKETKSALSPDLAEALLRNLLKREERIAAEEVTKENASIAKQKQRMANQRARNQKFFNKQKTCRHLKGGKLKSRAQVEDYALFHHTYIDKKQMIGCFICKMRWRPGDTKAYLLRTDADGVVHKIQNHTGIGWQEANDMFIKSSNTPTSSEIPQVMSIAPDSADEEGIEPAEVQ